MTASGMVLAAVPSFSGSLKELIWAEKCWFLINGLESLIIILKSVGRVTRLNEYHMERLQVEIFFHRYSFHFTQTVHSTYSSLYARSPTVQTDIPEMCRK